MQVQFMTDHHIPGFKYSKGQIIEASERPSDQIARWLNRGIIAPVQENPIREAVVSAQPKTKGKKVNE